MTHNRKIKILILRLYKIMYVIFIKETVEKEPNGDFLLSLAMGLFLYNFYVV